MCRPIASGLQFAAFNNASGSFVLPQASFTGDDPQIAGSCKSQTPDTGLHIYLYKLLAFVYTCINCVCVQVVPGTRMLALVA